IGNSRIAMIGKTIRQPVSYSLGDRRLQINRNSTVFPERTQIVYPSGMVIMYMSNQYRIDSFNMESQHLLTKIGATIDQYVLTLYLNYGRGSQPTVPRIGRSTYRTRTTDLRYSG